MKLRFTILTLSLILITVFKSNAQLGFGAEVYGGIQKSFVDVNYSSPAFANVLTVRSPFDFHAGATFLTSFHQNWQLALQGEFYRVAVREIWAGNIGQNVVRGDEYGIYSLGIRYNIEKEGYAFYLQPSFGYALNNYEDSGTTQMALGPVVRAEVGLKNYFKESKDYFFWGLRYQYGFENMNKGNFLDTGNYRVGSYGDYVGAFVGLGFDFSK
ncbi:hypothetical protein A33Q_2026 [Indibacter alkaliphilus LW1]|uniref:Outer membrane protein beta-barrel domain-containing protein n=1 Tax=Indibacter alkaliphilus (strain CCUG 57479 / KCTC 22604 / LW1) TaxID=1189612 RepID=S2DX95_INDAL|nr:hypothetical protein [Indibacter alkaliphilus]EOZ96716.1 hypothetical protein A33Q_2026 [Indibacter alkaliphilus LW1]